MGKNIAPTRRLREHLGLNQSAFARELGCAQPSVWAWENGVQIGGAWAAEILEAYPDALAELKISPLQLLRG